jgi:uncharacterized protein (TIGR03067 family)
LAHALVWAALLAGVLKTVPLARGAFDQLQMKLPWLTEAVLAWPIAALDLGPLAVGVFILAVLADIALLAWLDRPGGRKILRELWSGQVVVVPVVLLALTTMAMVLPFAKLADAMARGGFARNSVAQKEIDRLQGTWALVRAERDGKEVPAGQSDIRTLTVRQNQFTIEGLGEPLAGTFNVQPSRRPMGIDLFHTAGPQQGEEQQGIYRLAGDRLTICLAPVLAAGDDLPNDFATAGTKWVLYVFERARGSK